MEDRSSALLIIDVQIGLLELVPPEVQSSVLSKIKTLLTKARASGTPVIYIQHDGPRGHPLETHTKGWEIHPSIRPLDSESVVRKRESDSFFETTLQRELENRGDHAPNHFGRHDGILCGHHLPTCYESRL